MIRALSKDLLMAIDRVDPGMVSRGERASTVNISSKGGEAELLTFCNSGGARARFAVSGGMDGVDVDYAKLKSIVGKVNSEWVELSCHGPSLLITSNDLSASIRCSLDDTPPYFMVGGEPIDIFIEEGLARKAFSAAPLFCSASSNYAARAHTLGAIITSGGSDRLHFSAGNGHAAMSLAVAARGGDILDRAVIAPVDFMAALSRLPSWGGGVTLRITSNAVVAVFEWGEVASSLVEYSGADVYNPVFSRARSSACSADTAAGSVAIKDLLLGIDTAATICGHDRSLTFAVRDGGLSIAGRSGASETLETIIPCADTVFGGGFMAAHGYIAAVAKAARIFGAGAVSIKSVSDDVIAISADGVPDAFFVVMPIRRPQ